MIKFEKIKNSVHFLISCFLYLKNFILLDKIMIMKNQTFIKKILLILFIVFYLFLFLITFFYNYKYFFSTSKEILERDIMLHLRYIADDSKEGRYPNTAGSKNVQNWIVGFYRRLGLHPLFDGSYLQQFSFKGKYIKVQENYVQRIDCNECRIPLEPMPLGETGAFRKKMIQGNYCIEEKKELSQLIQKYRIQNPTDYVVICKRYGNPEYEKENPKEYQKWITFENKYKNIDLLGFAGVIFLKDQGEFISTEHFSLTKKGKAFGSLLDNTTYEESFKKLIENIDNQEYQFEIHYQQENLNGYNIGASLKRFDPQQKVIYLGAHYDHLGYGIPQFSLGPMGAIYNGADDNASGTVGVMELAEFFSKEFYRGKLNLPDDWNIVFLHFDAEEWGLYGSNYFVDSNYLSKQPIAMLNFDMIGRYRNSLQLQGLETGDEVWQSIIKKHVDDSMNRNIIKIQFLKGASGPSDHTSFYKKKMPVLFFFTGSHEDYHKPSDDYDKINYQQMKYILNLAKNILLDLILSKHIPEYQKVQEEASTREYKIRLGIIPQNYFSDEGIEVGGFVENAPIQKSGIREGDVIIKIEDYQIKNIYDLMDFLSNAQLGKKYKIIYKRNNQIFEAYTELMGK